MAIDRRKVLRSWPIGHDVVTPPLLLCLAIWMHRSDLIVSVSKRVVLKTLGLFVVLSQYLVLSAVTLSS